jgi:ribonuclease T2
MRVIGWLGVAACVVLLAGCKPPAGSPSSNGSSTRNGSSSQNDSYAQGGNTSRSAGHRTGGYGGSDGDSTGNGSRRDQRHGGARTAAPGHFDYYLLTLSWSPEFCYTHPDKPECGSGARFVTHGLWPENSDGSYPEHCSDAPGPADPSQYADLYPDQGLLAHEWQTHGTCSGMGPDAYFSAMRRTVAGVHIPAALAGISTQISMSPDQIVSGFVQANPGTSADEFSVGCGNNFLSQVQMCVDKNLRPTACQGLNSCRATVVKVTPPGAHRGESGSGPGSGYGGGGYTQSGGGYGQSSDAQSQGGNDSDDGNGEYHHRRHHHHD